MLFRRAQSSLARSGTRVRFLPPVAHPSTILAKASLEARIHQMQSAPQAGPSAAWGAPLKSLNCRCVEKRG
jgi:hypothetical protein